MRRGTFKDETVDYAASVVDVIVQLSRRGGVRRIEDIEVLGTVRGRRQ